MSNIYLKVTTEDILKTRFSGFKKCHHVSFWKALAQADIIEFSNFLLSLKNLKSGGQNCLWLFYYLNFERNYYVLKSKNSWILLNKNINFNKNKTESKMGDPTHSFRETNAAPQSA